MAKKDGAADTIQLLKNHIKAKEPGQFYIFHGEEQFLLNHYLTSLRKIMLDPLTESFNYHRLNSETFSIRQLIDAVEAMPMMAERTLVLVEDIDLFKLPEDDRVKVAQLVSDIPQWCTLILVYETVLWHPDKRLKRFWDAISSNALIVEFAKQNQRDLVAWIQRHFAAYHKRISAELCVYLIEITDGTMTALHGEINKICAYSGSDDICRADIDAVTEPVMDAVVFQMTDLISAGNFGTAFEKLQILFKMQEEPLSILGAIGNHFRRISAGRTLIDAGKSSVHLQKIYNLSDYPARKAMEAARKIRPEYCRKAAELVLETDYRIKTSYDYSERLLELLLMRLAQEAKHG